MREGSEVTETGTIQKAMYPGLIWEWALSSDQYRGIATYY
jgi:hypothetical protein